MYEALFLIDPQLRDEDVEQLMASIKDLVAKGGGTVTAEENWGRKSLAYEIRRRKDAFYYLLNFELDEAGLKTLAGACKLNDKILRHTVFRKKPA